MSMASRWQRILSVMAVAVAVAAPGCKTSSTWNAKPSWWTFGGSGEDPAKLAAAPAAPTDVTKPSATSKPYPTTSTPEGYSLAGTQAAAGGGTAAAAATPAAAEPAIVTYGSTPPPSAAPAAAAPAQQVATAPASGGLSSITPQVGPYRGATGTPADSALPSASTAPASFAAQPDATAAAIAPASAFGAALSQPAPSPDPLAAPAPATARVADARGSDGWSPAASPPGSRYGDASASRFGGAGTTPALGGPPTPPPAELQPAPAAVPPADLPTAPPTPTRRPDRGYRPGGTSSYRPSRTILADEPMADPSPVRQASFEAAMPMESPTSP